MKKLTYFSYALLLGLTIACGSKEETNDQKAQEVATTTPKTETAAKPAIHPGKGVYSRVCMVCHQKDGTGIPNMYPPLEKSDWVAGDEERLINIMLNGLDGEITVNGVKYEGNMPPVSYLSDAEIANVLSYVRQSFGNDAPAVTEEAVAKVRAGGN
ncbi:cytochrome c [Rapidithrix thailandica]|uniref:Cytochrome c n=1 Tax=Rapidithrix thailandica TaxID=413964 RepID=A0AAW9RSX2_9BACT